MVRNVSRRSCIKSLGVASLVATTGCLNASPSGGEDLRSADTENSQEKSFRVSIYLDKYFSDMHLSESINDTNNPEDTLKTVGKALRYAASSIPDENDRLRMKVDINTNPINMSKHSDEDNPANVSFTPKNAISIFEEEVESDAHSNILLCGTSVSGASGAALGGSGEQGFCVAEAPTPFFGISEEDLKEPKGTLSSFRFVSYAIHEVGHNMGLTHDMGTVEKIDDGVVYVTPMLFRYVRSSEYNNQENFFGQDIPDVPEDSMLKETPKFNSEIGLDNIDTNLPIEEE